MKSILVCVDFSDATNRVVDAACEIAKSTGCEVHLAHVVIPDAAFVATSPYFAPASTVIERTDTKIQQQQIQVIAERVKQTGAQTRTDVLEGAIADEILAEAENSGADAIVMGSHGHGALYELFVGSVTESVLHRSKVPVVVVPARKP